MRLAAVASRGTAVSWQLPGGLRAAFARLAAALRPTTSASSLHQVHLLEEVHLEGLNPSALLEHAHLLTTRMFVLVCAWICWRVRKRQRR